MQYYQTCVALGSKTGISLVSALQKTKVDIVYQRLWRNIFLFERQFSRFLPGSEPSAFNRAAASRLLRHNSAICYWPPKPWPWKQMGYTTLHSAGATSRWLYTLARTRARARCQ